MFDGLMMDEGGGLSAGALTDCTDALMMKGGVAWRRVKQGKVRQCAAGRPQRSHAAARVDSHGLVSQTQMPGMSKSMEMSFWLTFFGRSLSHLPPSYPSLPLPPSLLTVASLLQAASDNCRVYTQASAVPPV